MIDKLDAALRFHQEALNLRARRQEVLSANIANVDTPHYKARDFDFAASLSQAVERGRQAGSVALALTAGRHLAGQAVPAAAGELAYRVPAQASIDGNTVEMDLERVAFADNAVHYESSLTVLGGQIRTLLAAVQQ
ncbi:flagellar basal body rod protein FlgB [Ramlibacter tataouinensis]|uniref:flagellar basal body rod protein FlgB n=1 Tax=Ramlibacter tataouinensis TaxID=94132 RepID=UPI0022F392C1|nr:flagellar basal body rod protein FlgB [Ramlibacter tataouinensis]WBY00590.1 flagellar basal body rod protein FlgB [Ramlibacter tataouinensis]